MKRQVPTATKHGDKTTGGAPRTAGNRACGRNHPAIYTASLVSECSSAW
jgi:hypothetical protein